jgi:hypothetical protein
MTKNPSTFLQHVRTLTEQIEQLGPLKLPVAGADGDLRETILLYLRTKLLPELESTQDFPVFVGIQGGTNVGKSTVFNALAGKLLSPAIVQASATKHPLVFVHEKWRALFLDKKPFPNTTYAELGDAKELLVEANRTDLLYFRFHNDDALADITLVDSPDFDSTLLTNLHVARRIAALSDITIFVTTSQKYRDRELVKHLKLLVNLKATVLLVLNMVNEEIVYQTLLDDLETIVPLKTSGVATIRLPASSAQYPEEEFRDPLRQRVLGHLSAFDRSQVKPAILRKTLARVLEHVAALRRRFEPELRFKDNLQKRIAEGNEQQVAAYTSAFNLALPEETLAIRRLIQLTELWRHLHLIPVVQEGSRSLTAVAQLFKKIGDSTRNFILRLARNEEGSIDETADTLSEYESTRNDSDFERVSRAAEHLKTNLESFCRGNEDNSPIARKLMSSFFTPDCATSLTEKSREAFDRECADPSVNPEATGGKILRDLDSWLERHNFLKNVIFVGANIFKIACGLFTATVIPPDGYLFSFLNWIYFMSGYLVGAYIVALVISITIRRKKRFKKARVEGMRAVLDRVLVHPLGETLDGLLARSKIESIGKTAQGIAALPEMSEAVAAPVSAEASS